MDYGTGQSAQVEGYEIGAKTGTAEKLPRGNGNYLLSYIACAPASNPEVVIYVVIDEPECGGAGGQLSGPRALKSDHGRGVPVSGDHDDRGESGDAPDRGRGDRGDRVYGL